MQLLEEAATLWGGKPMTEAEALQSGFLDPYPDGKIHLDWPLSRGMAARILTRLVRRAGRTASGSRAFADIPANSTFFPLLAEVGPAFQAQARDRFAPEQIFSPEDLRYAIEALSRFPAAATGVAVPASPVSESTPAASETLTVPAVPAASEPDLAGLKAEIFPRLGFPERDALLASSSVRASLSSDVLRLERLASFVPGDQLAPQNAFDLVAAAEGVAEMETSLDSFELTVYDVTLAEPAEEGLVNEVRDFLTQMRGTLADVARKLRHSRLQLKNALLVDPESMRLCADLRSRIDTALFRLGQLSERVDQRLAGMPPRKKSE